MFFVCALEDFLVKFESFCMDFLFFKEFVNKINAVFFELMKDFKWLEGVEFQFEFDNVLYVFKGDVRNVLLIYNLIKVLGLDRVLSWLLREYVSIFMNLIVVVLNSSFCEQKFFQRWKMVDVVLIFKE